MCTYVKKEGSAWKQIEINDVYFKSLSLYVYSPLSFNPPCWLEKSKKELTAKGRDGVRGHF
jgi:hypothetical protein